MKKFLIPKAILFDLDDTILDDDIVSEEAWKETCVINANMVASVTVDELFRQINIDRTAFWNDRANLMGGAWKNLFQSRMTIVRSALKKLSCENDEIAREIVNTYEILKVKMVRLFPNAERTLNELERRGIKLALLTNGAAESQKTKIRKMELEAHFAVCLIEGEVGFGKPDPRIFQMAVDKLQVSPVDTWMVGDRLEFDILGAQNVGIKGIWCDYRRKGLPADSTVIPEAIIHDISDLINLIAER